MNYISFMLDPTWTKGRVNKGKNRKFQSTFYPLCLSKRNKLHPEIRLAPSIAAFKTKLLSEIRPLPKSVFQTHDPTGLLYLIQPRLGISKLNFHLQRYYKPNVPYQRGSQTHGALFVALLFF